MMVKIADLINVTTCDDKTECDLVVGREMSVRDVLAQMEESQSKYVGINLEGDGGRVVISKNDLVDSLLREIDRAGEKLVDIQKSIDEEVSDQLDLVTEYTRSMADAETSKLRAAINYMTEGMVIIDVDGKIEECNPSAKQIFGLERSDCTESFSEVFDDYGFREFFTESVNQSVDNWGNFKMKSPCGAFIQIRWTQMVDETGDVIGSLVMLRDVTDELAGEKAKKEFIAAITHELRTPLTIIQNSVSNILVGVTGKISRKLRNYLETIQGDCKRLGVLVSDLLDVSKIEAGNMLLNRQVMQIGECIVASLEKYSSQAKDKGIKISKFNESYISPVYADRDRIGQVLSHLLANSIKFSETGATVSVSCYEEGKSIVTVVEDTGIGISHLNQKHLFNKFHQIGRQAGAGYKGMGLGLSICKGITEMHGGRIWVESQEGAGSKMFFSLPKLDPTIVLNKHLGALEQDSKISGEEFALMSLRFEFDHSKKEQFREIIGTCVQELLDSSSNFLDEKKDLALEISDFELVFAVSKARKKRIDAVKAEIVNIIRKKKFNSEAIVPKIGTGVYPTDTSEIMQLGQVARNAALEF